MKRHLLTLSLLTIIYFVKAQQQTNFYATLFYNSTNNTLTTTYYINNTNNGNCNMKIAVLPLEMQWNPAVLTLQSISFLPSGAKLDILGEQFPGSNKNDTDSALNDKSVSTYSKTFKRMFYRRSTNLCDNTLVLACGQYLPVFQAVFTFVSPAAASNYDFITPTATNYIGEFIGGSTNTPSTSYRELIFVANRLFDQAGSDGTCPAGSTVGQVNNVPNASGGEVFVTTQAPLPVKMKYFEVYQQNNQVKLQWETATEYSNKGFEIQRKTRNGFETIGYIPSKSEGGESESSLSYVYIDPEVTIGTVYYRLKQISYLAKESYSEIRAIQSSRQLRVLAYPNPSSGHINIVLPDDKGTTDISMIDFSGKLIRTWSGYRIPTIQLSGLQKGIYTLLISNRESGEKVSQKITVQ